MFYFLQSLQTDLIDDAGQVWSSLKPFPCTEILGGKTPKTQRKIGKSKTPLILCCRVRLPDYTQVSFRGEITSCIDLREERGKKIKNPSLYRGYVILYWAIIRHLYSTLVASVIPLLSCHYQCRLINHIQSTAGWHSRGLNNSGVDIDTPMLLAAAPCDLFHFNPNLCTPRHSDPPQRTLSKRLPLRPLSHPISPQRIYGKKTRVKKKRRPARSAYA